MKYYSGLFSLILLALSIISYTQFREERALAIGCDTYYRVTGKIAGCNDVNTEDARNLWLNRYSVCLEQQLSRNIAIYNRQLKIYYAQLQENEQISDAEFNDIFFQDLDIAPLSLSETQSRTYRGNADFCQ